MPPTEWDENGNVITAPTIASQEWDEQGHPVQASSPETPNAIARRIQAEQPNFYARHPVASEAALGFLEGASGAPETQTPIKDLVHNMGNLFVPETPNAPPNRPMGRAARRNAMAQPGITPQMRAAAPENTTVMTPLVPLPNLARGMIAANREYGSQVYQGVRSGDMPSVAHGSSAILGELLTLYLGYKVDPGAPKPFGVMTPKQELFTHGVARLGDSMEATQGMFKSGMKGMSNAVEVAADAVRQLDQKASPNGSLNPTPAHTALLNAKAAISNEPKMFPSVDIAEKMLDNATGKPQTWENVKQLRTRVSGLMVNASSTERGMLMAAKDELTTMLKDRATALGARPEFDKYNAIHSKLMGFKQDILDNLTQAHNDPTNYFQKMYTSAQKQVLLPKVNEILNEFDKYNNAGSAIREELVNNKVFRDILTKSENTGLMGRLRAIASHPLYGGMGVLIGGLAGRASGFPGGSWLGGMAGAGMGAGLADRLALIEALNAIRPPVAPPGGAQPTGGGGAAPNIGAPTMGGPVGGQVPPTGAPVGGGRGMLANMIQQIMSKVSGEGGTTPPGEGSIDDPQLLQRLQDLRNPVYDMSNRPAVNDLAQQLSTTLGKRKGKY